MSVFVDTSAIVAFSDSVDPVHLAAQATWRELRERATPLVSTNYVVLETTAVLQRRFGMDAAARFCELMVPVLDVRYVGPATHDLGVASWLAASRRQLSLVDMVSFAVMRREGIHQVFTIDPHFRERGFECLPHLGGGPAGQVSTPFSRNTPSDQ